MISVVTINLNNKEGLERTIESVVSQTHFADIEYIIIDGGSTDGSVDVIQRYKDKIAYWCSEPDGGIFNAFNKGIEHCNGDYAIFLNSGDHFYADDVIEKVIPELDCDIVYGNEMKQKGKPLKWMNGRWYTNCKWYTPASFNQLAKYPEKLTDRWFSISALPHQSTFICTELLKKHPYSEDWKILGDWLWFYERIILEGVSYKHIGQTISVYNLEGLSSRNQSTFQLERKEYLSKQKYHKVATV